MAGMMRRCALPAALAVAVWAHARAVPAASLRVAQAIGVRDGRDLILMVDFGKWGMCMNGGDDDDAEDGEEVVARGEEEAKKRMEEEESGEDWAAERRCGLLKELAQEKFWEVVKKEKVMVLWESTEFAGNGHNRRALREVGEVVHGIGNGQGMMKVILYSYVGWEPEIGKTRRWWTEQHKMTRRTWQAHPGSFGGWGRATLSLVEGGQIIWDVFDVVHSSKHRQYLEEFHFDKTESLAEDIERFARTGDLHLALEHVHDNHFDKDLMPLQVCLQIAKQVLSDVDRRSLFSGGGEKFLDSLAQFCEHQDVEEEEEHSAHRGDIDYERYLVFIRDMGLLGAKSSAWQLITEEWNRVLTFVSNGSKKPPLPQIGFLGSVVPVYEEGITRNLGVGDRHEALMISLCFFNASIPDKKLPERFYVRGFPQNSQPVFNSDVFLTAIPCGKLDSEEIMICMRAVMADLFANITDRWQSYGPFFEISGLMFGPGFSGDERYSKIAPFWLKEDHSQEFPPLEVSEEYSREQYARDAKEPGFNYKDEL